MNKHLLILLTLVSLMSGCRAVDEPSTVDTKPLDIEDNMDKSVKPGDNFFMYSNGAWWNKTDMQGVPFIGFIAEAQAISNQRIAKLNSEPIKEFWTKVANIDHTTQSAVELLHQHLKLVENITTTEQAHEAIIETMLVGYDNIIYTDVFFKDGNTYLGITFSKNFTLNLDWIRHSMEELGLQPTPSRSAKTSVLYGRLRQGQETLNMSLNNKEYPELLERMVSLKSTKASGSVLLDKILQTLKIDFEYVNIDSKMIEFFQELETAEPESVKYLLQSFIADKYRFTSRAAYNSYLTFETSAPDFDSAIDTFEAQKMMYLYSYAYSKQYVSPERKNQMQLYCEEMRAVFSNRITNIDWMSEPTKQKAKEKLETMSFNVGYPDDWIESALPTSLKGASMLEDMFTLSMAYDKIAQELVNTPAQRAVSHAIMATESVEIVNASYMPEVNSMFIFPAWMLEPLYDEQKSDAYNYAVFAVIGHEITHGFDNDGAKYNKIGKLENWWTVADQMEFNSRQQKLIDCYNLLEIMPSELPDVYANGTKTLDENIADLGGFQLALDAYNAKLLAQGYTGDELQKQHKKFFQSYANLWRNKYTSTHALRMLEKDEHSLSKERVNGVVMNVDLWYDLYDVEWGDKLYLKPEKRTYIW